MVVPRHDRPQGRLGPYLAYAAALHAAVFAVSSSHPAHATAAAEMVPTNAHSMNVDVEPANPDPPATPPGGGSPIPGAPKVATARPPSPAPASSQTTGVRAPRRGSVVEPLPSDLASAATEPEAQTDPTPTADDDAASRMAAMQASDDRRQRAMAMAAAAAAAGVGPGASGGPGGNGAGWGAPPIRGKIAFGNGSHGGLVGRVCFLPVGTLRIADVHDCQYVATVYTDTLDIPERHFYDGFPGVTNRSEWFLIDYTGMFSVTGYGTYVFRLHSDDGSYLYVDDMLIIENDGKHAPESRSGSVQLAIGEHRIKVRYAQTNDRMALQLFVRAPGARAEAIFTTQL